MPSQSSAPLDLAWGRAYVSALLLRAVCRSESVAQPRLPCPESNPPRSACVRPAPVPRRTAPSAAAFASALKKVRAATGAEVEAAYAEAVQLLDRAGRKHLIHPNAAARQKSRLAKLKAKAKAESGEA